jgi:hypothetical protein
MLFDKPMGEYDMDYIRFRLAELFGWTYEYIDNLPYRHLIAIFGILAGKAQAEQFKSLSKRH